MTLTLSWVSAALNKAREVTAVNLRGLDFLFILAFLFGLYVLHRLLVVRKEGEVEKGVVMTEFNGELRRLIGERRARRRRSPVSVTPTGGPMSQD